MVIWNKFCLATMFIHILWRHQNKRFRFIGESRQRMHFWLNYKNWVFSAFNCISILFFHGPGFRSTEKWVEESSHQNPSVWLLTNLMRNDFGTRLTKTSVEIFGNRKNLEKFLWKSSISETQLIQVNNHKPLVCNRQANAATGTELEQ